MLYGKKKYEEDFNYIMKRYEDNLNDKSWIEHLLNAVKNNKVVNLTSDLWYLSGGGLESTKLMLQDLQHVFQ